MSRSWRAASWEGAHEIVHAGDDGRVRDPVLCDDLPHQDEELVGLLEIAARPAGIGHGGRGKDVEIKVGRCLRVPICDPPGQLGELVRLGRLVWDAPVTLLEQQLHQSRTAKATSGVLDPPHPFGLGERKKLVEVPFGAGRLPGTQVDQPVEAQGEDLEDLPDNGSLRIAFRRIGFDLAGASRRRG